MVARPLAAALALAVALVLAGCADSDTIGPDGTPTSVPHSSSSSPSATGSASTSTSTSSSSSAASSSSSGPAAPQTVEKDITDNAFPDGTFSLHVGDKVRWTHRGSNIHSVTSDGNFDSSPNCPPVCLVSGQTFEHTFDKAGSFQYRCKIHGSMTGTITVT